LRTWFMFDELGALHRLPAIENGLQTARAFGGAMILGIHSFEKLVEVYGEQGARNLASLARSKLILATADLDTAEQCARYIGNREVRQMDEAYSYGYNNTRDASTLTPRKQVEPLVIADDITNLPSMHGFVKFPDGFPAARILLEW
ncbi:type IV secretion system DNA-binding domain-containing protein, partial [Pandoraea nosoerga]|nr:type IV secretion system DNA-binding domain-containing protein [Pandoraea nosoerga]